MNVSGFIKKNIPLCICTLGFAIVGYMGYHAVRWVINKCKKTEKIDKVAQESLKKNNFEPKHGNQKSSSNPIESLVRRVSHLDSGVGKITVGQGEYVVFYGAEDRREVSREIYDQIYEILNEYAPAAIAERSPDTAKEECANRYETIQSKIKEIDSSLEAVFVPRTLYELIFIRKCIQEDIKHNKTCSELEPETHSLTVEDFLGDQQAFESFQEERQKRITEKKCWHLCYFNDVGDNNHPGVRDVAYRLNRAVTKTLSSTAGGFTQEELVKYTDEEINFLKSHYKSNKANQIGSSNRPGPTTNFGSESTRGSIKPMGIRDENDAQIIRDAVAVDCSKAAQKAFILYRGADFQKDSAACWSDKDKPYSLSFGSSLFAGCLFDGGATAFHYMRKQKNAYAIPVPFDQMNSSPFFVPPTNTIAQLFGNGEVFHARTKAWKDYDLKKIGGIQGGENSGQVGHLRSDLTKEELVTQFEEFKHRAIQLK